jgi:hypothetical protein
MPTVLRWGPYRAFFPRMKAKNRRTSHVRSGDKEAKFWVHDMSVAVNAGFPMHEIGDIIRHLKLNREKLLSIWHEHFGN